jgi:transposase-like protein
MEGFNMKNDERLEARRLRKEQGCSVREIAGKLGVSAGSVSRWVRDVVLSAEQEATLQARNPIFNHNLNGVATFTNHTHARKKREQWQLEGRQLYRDGDKRYAFGCALYYGEGSKGKNTVGLSNTDTRLMIFWVNFLRDFFEIQDGEFAVSITCYLNNGLTLEEIQNYWLKAVGLPITVLRKATVKGKYYSGTGSGKYPFGVCTVRVHKTDVVQKLFGSIKEATGDDGVSWLD